MRRFRRKGQSTLEYAVLISVVVVALLWVGIYVKRAAQGRLRQSTDQIGGQFEAAKTTISQTTINAGKTVDKTIEGVTNTYSNNTEGSTPTTESVYSTETVKRWDK